MRNQVIPEEDSEDISADEAEREGRGAVEKSLARMQTAGVMMRTNTLMKKKTIVTRQVTTVDDITGEILEQKTEQVI